MGEVTQWLPVVLALLISLVAIYFAVSPLLQPERATLLLDDDKLAELMGRKDALLQGIKDLEFDFRVGKINEEDYTRLDQRLRRQAIGLIQQIEKLAPASASLDEQLETIIAQFRQTTAPAVPQASAPVQPPPITTPEPTSASRFCTECGKPVAADHKFCAHCGAPITQVDPAT